MFDLGPVWCEFEDDATKCKSTAPFASYQRYRGRVLL
jgi:hypothetical protein